MVIITKIKQVSMCKIHKDELPFLGKNPLSLQKRALYDKMAPAREREAAK